MRQTKQAKEINQAFRAAFNQFKKKTGLTYRKIEAETNISNAHLCLFANGLVGISAEKQAEIQKYMDGF